VFENYVTELPVEELLSNCIFGIQLASRTLTASDLGYTDTHLGVITFAIDDPASLYKVENKVRNDTWASTLPGTMVLIPSPSGAKRSNTIFQNPHNS
jgi:hypothetical protein